jgi:hypothetical protein
VNRAVARYREQISREADLGRARLDEIEDHMRLLIDDLQASGLPTAKAITEAARRLGDPREVAREHARVGVAFGAKLPLWRALAVMALVLPLVIYEAVEGWNGYGWDGHYENALGFVLCAALLWRSSWSRAVWLGFTACSSVLSVIAVVYGHAPPAWMIACQLGAFVLLVPWRRTEITSTGWALALLWSIYVAAQWIDRLALSGPWVEADPHHIFYVTIFAGVGLVLRARWAAIAALATTVMLFPYLERFVDWNYHTIGLADDLQVYVVYQGVVASLAVAVIAWRTARSSVGDLKNVFA